MAAALRSGDVSPRRFWMTAGATSPTAPLTNRTTPSVFRATVPRAGTTVLPHPIDHRVNSTEERRTNTIGRVERTHVPPRPDVRRQPALHQIRTELPLAA